MDDLYRKITAENVLLDQTSRRLELDQDEVEQFYFPLAERILIECPISGRMVVAIAGPPGCGKSAFAAALALVINTIAGDEVARVVGLDGWHFPNDYLEQHFIVKNGQTISLRQVKGMPETYDGESILSFLKDVHRKKDLFFPVYSRELHNPLKNGGILDESNKIVLLEGNYWLLDAPPWNSFQQYFDLRIFLTAPAQNLVEGLRERHKRGGKSPEYIKRQLREVDLPNIELVLAHSIGADILVEKIDHRRIQKTYL